MLYANGHVEFLINYETFLKRNVSVNGTTTSGMLAHVVKSNSLTSEQMLLPLHEMRDPLS